MVQIDLGMSIIKRTKLILISKPIWRNMKVILLSSNKYPGFETIVDDEDFNELIQYKWHLKVVKKKWSISYYAVANYDQKQIYMHRLIMALHGYDIENKLIDHKDQNGLNNQKENLRICNLSENAQNARKPKHGKTSKYKGVSVRKSTNKYHSYIMLNQKRIHIGYFTNEIDAAIAYNKKAIELFGEFACLNIIKI